MTGILPPVAGNANDRFAVQEVIRRFMNDTRMEIHRLNAPTPFPADAVHFGSHGGRSGCHREQAEAALAPARALLDHSPVLVEVMPGDSMSTWERRGIPAAVGALLGLTLAAVD